MRGHSWRVPAGAACVGDADLNFPPKVEQWASDRVRRTKSSRTSVVDEVLNDRFTDNDINDIRSKAELMVNSTSESFAKDIKVPVSSVTEALEVWRLQLGNDIDKEFILAGVANGFVLVDEHSDLDSYDCRNYNSTLLENRDLVEEQILKEVEKGRYIISEEPPPIVSALGAVPKSAQKLD